MYNKNIEFWGGVLVAIERRLKMGYTHYWSQINECPVETWDRIVDDVNKLLSNLDKATNEKQFPVFIVNGFGDLNSKPVVDGSHIWLNGVKPFDCETFLFSRIDSRGFCKTNKNHYDVVVCAILLVAQAHAPEIYTITSDGNYDDWSAAIKFYTQVFNKFPELPKNIRPTVVA